MTPTTRWLWILPAIGALAAPSPAQSMPNPTYANVAYGSQPLETMDVYLAPSAQLTACAIEVHPGGWGGGSKSDFHDYGGTIEGLFNRGITIVSINYPLAPQATYPVPNKSVQRAVQFVRANAGAWNIQKDGIGAIGISAGAQLALWTGLSKDAANAHSSDPVVHESSRLCAVVAIGAPTDFSAAYYKHDPQQSPKSPVWDYFGVTTQAQWDAIPTATKNAASPRWLVANGAGLDANKSLSVLGVYAGTAWLTSSSQLQQPTSDVHSLLFGMLLLEALRVSPVADVSLWIGTETLDPSGALYAKRGAAEWLQSRLLGADARNYGFGTPACLRTQLVAPSGPAKLGNAGYQIVSYGGMPGSLGLILAGSQPLPDLADPLGLGFWLLVDPFAPGFTGYDAATDAQGEAALTAPIPNDPSLLGLAVYLQGISLWPGFPVTCSPSIHNLSTTPGLEIRFQ
jgi:hypothetical protein